MKLTMNATATNPKRKANSRGVVRLTSIRPSPENDKLYRPIDETDPQIVELANSIVKYGLLEPIIVTADGWIVSGHRRYTAAKLTNLIEVPIKRLKVRRDDDLDGFVRLLREHNRQRDKTSAEKLREELVSVDAARAHAELRKFRRAIAVVHTAKLKVGHGPLRKKISEAKAPMLAAVQAVIEGLSDFWPVSDRQIHYGLLNNPPLIHASKRDSIYRNDLASYKRLVDLLTRARLEGHIDFDSIGDETRSVKEWSVFENPRPFISHQLFRMFRGYYRDLMQSQPNHIEIIGEKNTVRSTLEPVAAQYTIPITIGRGFCSLPPRYEMAQRFEESGKENLILLLVSDFDPDGEEIAHSFARSMRDDFGIDAIHPVKVALTAEQVKEHKLPPIMRAKATSSRYSKFVERHGHDVFELEALSPATLQEVLRATIEGVIDRHAFEEEIAAERDDAAFLEGLRNRVHDALGEIEIEEAQ